MEALDVLVFAPHPDDAELGMGGTIAKLLAAGKRVGVVDLTRGELGTKGDAEIRKQEAQAATEFLGLTYRSNLDLGDGFIEDSKENRIKVVEEIRRCCPTQLYVCPPFDPHPDHQAAAQVVRGAFFLSRLPKFETSFPAFSPRRLFYYFIHRMDSISFAIDISETFDKKIGSMKCYVSQFVDAKVPENYRYVGTGDYLAQLEAYNRTIGAQIGARYAEGFSSESALSLHLPTDLK